MPNKDTPTAPDTGNASMAGSSETAEMSPSDAGRFEFGRNWTNYLTALNDQRIVAAQRSLQTLLGTDSLDGQRFLDAGSGSGLFSLAANRLGAEVTSFDVDPESVACAREVKKRFANQAANWRIVQGSLTDRGFLGTLGEFEVIYCWGVAHHTGSMWQCVEDLLPLIRSGGTIAIAIYNDQQYISRVWRAVKSIYQRLPRFARPALVAVIGMSTVLKRTSVTAVACLLRVITLRNPFVPITNWARETQARGMHGWYDLVDWVGGWPFEVARPEEVFRFMRDHGFTLQELTTSTGHGCNEFVFVRNTPDGEETAAP